MHFLCIISSKPYIPDVFSLDLYPDTFSLDRLTPGVDNVRYDVYLSPEFYKTAVKVIRHSILRHSQASEIFYDKKIQSNWNSDRTELKRLTNEVLQSAVSKTKLDREIQVNFLAQIAIIKLFLEEVRNQYSTLIEQYKNTIRKEEISSKGSLKEVIKLKNELSNIQKSKRSIFRDASGEVFQYLFDVHDENFKEVCLANFGPDSLLTDDTFHNPILYTEKMIDDFFMIEEYILFGFRSKDPIKYDSILSLIKDFYKEIEKNNYVEADKSEKDFDISENDSDSFEDEISNAFDRNVDRWIKQITNVDKLLNCYQTKAFLIELRKKKGSKKNITATKKKIKSQKRLINYIYKKFDRVKLIDGIVASYEMQPLYKEYCPPSFPYLPQRLHGECCRGVKG